MTPNKRKSNNSSSSRTVSSTKTPRRREITAAVFFLLAVFSFIGFFDATGIFIGFFAGFIKGLVGPGFFFTPFALAAASFILCFHRGRPVRFRVSCVLLSVVLIAASWHLFASKSSYPFSFDMVPLLWSDGRLLISGGFISGSLAVIFNYLFSKAGAAIVFFSVTAMLILNAANITIPSLIDKWRNRDRPVYTPQPKPERHRNKTNQDVPADLQPAAQQPNPKQKRQKFIDIPVDGEELQSPDTKPDPKNSFFKASPGVKTPDQHIMESITESDDNTDPHYEPEPQTEVEFAPLISLPVIEKTTLPPEPPIPVSAAVDIRLPESFADPVIQYPQEPFIPDLLAAGAVEYTFPPIDLLAVGGVGSTMDGSEEVRLNSERLESAFRSFGVNVKISNATRGPTVTRYEAELEAGIKLSKLTGLADDIALSLGTGGVRIAAMPNKMSTVGIEVPNKLISKVLLRDIIESPDFTRASSKLTFAIGKNISGDAVVGNISKLPHMLVAGTTGSGKSVCLNSIILSILYKATPDDVRLIMIDPKMVEFRVYNSIPHLLIPVVTDVKKASGALQWAVSEMMRRYKIFSESNARDLEGYNILAARSDDADPLPQIVVIIDELADLMMTAAKEVEESICRVAQMGRAAGVHLIIATQSPRADVITGLMKANIPSRIALKVSSSLESRIILDAGGAADKLVGNGDMLFAPIGTTKPIRIQGTWVSDEEREEVVNFIKLSGKAQYAQDVISEIEKVSAGKSPASAKDKTADDQDEPPANDEMLPQAVDVIFETGQASVSMLQRRLKLGYARAARIVDQLEQLGIVGPFEGSKPRAILISNEQWRDMQLNFLSDNNAPLS